MNIRLILILIFLMLSGCDARGPTPENSPSATEFKVSTLFKIPELNEISGIQQGTGSDFFVHNDEGKALLHVINTSGQKIASIRIRGAENRDWEDIGRIQRADGNLLVLADIGDNKARHKTVRLFFVVEPVPDDSGRYPQETTLHHKLKARYPDGARDCEAMAWDPVSQRILFMSKRDRPPRLYGLPLETALGKAEAELEFLVEIDTLRPPSAKDLLLGGDRGNWVSQPTGMDISADGSRLAVITYRSLYLWFREGPESWEELLRQAPTEIIGPPGLHEEAVSFGHSRNEIYVTTEGVPTPLYRLQIP